MYIKIYYLQIFIYLCGVKKTSTVMKILKMLPHVWQKVGMILLALSLLVFAICFKAVIHDLVLVNSSYGMDSFGRVWASDLVVVVFTIGVVLVALSKEKAEDERIYAIRQQTVIRTVVLYLVIGALSLVANLFIMRWIRETNTMMMVLWIKRYFTCVPAFILYYVLIFKVSLWSDNKRLGDEE